MRGLRPPPCPLAGRRCTHGQHCWLGAGWKPYSSTRSWAPVRGRDFGAGTSPSNPKISRTSATSSWCKLLGGSIVRNTLRNILRQHILHRRFATAIWFCCAIGLVPQKLTIFSITSKESLLIAFVRAEMLKPGLFQQGYVRSPSPPTHPPCVAAIPGAPGFYKGPGRGHRGHVGHTP